MNTKQAPHANFSRAHIIPPHPYSDHQQQKTSLRSHTIRLMHDALAAHFQHHNDAIPAMLHHHSGTTQSHLDPFTAPCKRIVGTDMAHLRTQFDTVTTILAPKQVSGCRVARCRLVTEAVSYVTHRHVLGVKPSAVARADSFGLVRAFVAFKTRLHTSRCGAHERPVRPVDAAGTCVCAVSNVACDQTIPRCNHTRSVMCPEQAAWNPLLAPHAPCYHAAAPGTALVP